MNYEENIELSSEELDAIQNTEAELHERKEVEE